MNPYKIVHDFEKALAKFVGAPFAVAVDSCTNALFLCCKYLNVEEVTLPAKTYISVPCSVHHAGGKPKFEHVEWSGQYQLKPYPIWDAACQLNMGMYQTGTFQCISFSSNKPLNIGKGGMIFTDDERAYKWFKLARYEGRNEVPISQDDPVMFGWNMYMTPEQAARGLLLTLHLKEENMVFPEYPDLTKFTLYRT
jgi:dTDP-4-amino-4,6-dideoxygalactose transaminase